MARPLAIVSGLLRGGPLGIASSDQDMVQDVERETLDPKLKELIDDESRPKEGFLFCTACSHVIGHVQDRIEVQGSFEHTCTNPHGYVHRFGCHRDAPGCAIGGDRQAADSWFRGFHWRLASCANCGTHMGWLFDRQEAHFFGLILDRIQVG